MKSIPEPKKVAAFNRNLMLVGIFHSLVHASKITGKTHQTIMYAANGDQVTAAGFYWRFIPENIILDLDDLGRLSLLQFDKECGNDRLIHKNSHWKYNDLVLESEVRKYNKNYK